MRLIYFMIITGKNGGVVRKQELSDGLTLIRQTCRIIKGI
jgi:hypothetical protein